MAVHEFTYLSSWHGVSSTLADRQEAVKAFWQKADPICIDDPRSESFKQFIDRVYAFHARIEAIVFESVAFHYRIAIFSHEQFITAVIWLLQQGQIDISSENMRFFRTIVKDNPVPNGAIVQITFQEEPSNWSYDLITDHLSAKKDKLLQKMDVESSLSS